MGKVHGSLARAGKQLPGAFGAFALAAPLERERGLTSARRQGQVADPQGTACRIDTPRLIPPKHRD
jgi:hypothetical protein